MSPPTADRRPRPVVAAAGGLTAVLVALGLMSGVSAQTVPAPDGRIAYLEDRARIRVAEADGSGDQVVFGITPDAVGGIETVAWRPDGARLAFTSGHERQCSIWLADVYVIDDDGTDLTRLTNGPACGALAGTPQGAIRVTIVNTLPEVGEILIGVQGMASAVGAVVDPGSQSTFELTGVHDLGDQTPQFVAVSVGTSTWFDGAVFADVVPDATVDAGTLTLTEETLESWGALAASWSHDGSRLAYQQGLGSLWQIEAGASQLDIGRPLFGGDLPGFSATTPTWSPIDGRVLYQAFDASGASIDLGRADADGAGDTLLDATLVQGIDWMPDGSGFVYSDSLPSLEVANLFHSDLRSGVVERITGFDTGLALWPTVSPDGRFVAYAYSPVPLEQAGAVEIRIRHLGTGQERLLSANGVNPDWGP